MKQRGSKRNPIHVEVIEEPPCVGEAVNFRLRRGRRHQARKVIDIKVNCEPARGAPANRHVRGRAQTKAVNERRH